MPVIPNNLHFLDYPKTLKKLIFNPSISLDKSLHNQEIISLSYTIDEIDPLIFFSVMKEENQVSFYWENQQKNESIVAIGAIKFLQVDNLESEPNNIHNRFILCSNFIENIKKNYRLNSDHNVCFISYFSFLNNNYNSFPSATTFLPYLQLVKKKNNYQLIINTYNDQDNILLIKQYLQENFSKNIINSYQFYTETPNILNYNLAETQSQSFIEKVEEGLKSIEEKKLTKIVVAHALEVTANQEINIIKSLNNLRKNYPNCYVFAIGNKPQEYFIGASPERLLSIKNKHLISDALAGSAPRGKNTIEDISIGKKLLNSEKEKREHIVVRDFIFEQLLKMGLNPEKAELQLLKLSNIQHLWTPISASLTDNLNPLEIIAKLHPTPAVAGIPVDTACEQIKALENFDRALYSGSIGWLDLQGNSEFVVGIRSAFIKENLARLYAGAGIVEGSEPTQELSEIKLKFQALLQSLI